MSSIYQIKAKLLEAMERVEDGDYNRYPDDVKRIRQIVSDQLGVNLDLAETITLWEDVSESRCAGWLIVPKDDNELLEMIKDYCKGY